jgi:epoxyqueuosine reductase
MEPLKAVRKEIYSVSVRGKLEGREGQLNRAAGKLYAQLEDRGLKGRVVSIGHLPELREDIFSRHDQGAFDRDFYQERLTFFNFSPPVEFPEVRSMIVVAVPRPQTHLRFTRFEKTLTLILPPTYLGYSQIFRQIDELLGELLVPEGYQVVPAVLPQKLLTVRSGLAKYGRNNITYIPGLGSFYQPTVFFSDLPPEEDVWSDLGMMERCQTCQACMLKCPTGAINGERFLIHAERCLVFLNERSSKYPFPSWVDPAVHNCVMGCMICQLFCPEDKPFLEWFEGDEEFSHEETSLLLKGVTKEQLSAETVKKLERLELLDDLDKMPRNLGVFFAD